MEGFFTGHKNNILRQNEAVERLAHKRLQACNTCPYKRDFGIAYCGKCGCPLAALSRQNQKKCEVWRHYGL